MKRKVIMEREYSQKYLQVMRLKNKVALYDADDTPFFRVSPELSSLAENPGTAERFQSQFPDLNFSRACLADGNIMIQDLEPLRYDGSGWLRSYELNRDSAQLNSASSVTIQIADGVEMTKDLLELLKRDNVLDKNPLVILPGNGAQAVRESIEYILNSTIDSVVEIPTKRTLLPSKKFSLRVNYSNLPNDTNAGCAIIFDDVVASGQTVEEITRELKSRYNGIECIVASWIMLFPTLPRNLQTSSGIYPVDKTYTAIALAGNGVSRPPINSLSCMIDTQNNQDYEGRKNEYKRKYFGNSDQFDELLYQIRSNLSHQL